MDESPPAPTAIGALKTTLLRLTMKPTRTSIVGGEGGDSSSSALLPRRRSSLFPTTTTSHRRLSALVAVLIGIQLVAVYYTGTTVVTESERRNSSPWTSKDGNCTLSDKFQELHSRIHFRPGGSTRSRRKQKTALSEEAAEADTEEDFDIFSDRDGARMPVNVTCPQLVHHFHWINDRYRHNAIGGEGDINIPSATRHEPLINTAWYQGQGFGRLIDHSVLHCLLALALDRPCVVDMKDRDPYYTWRSFVHTGSYNWEMTAKPASDLRPSIRAALEMLPSQEEGTWDVADLTRSFPDLVPLVRPSHWPSEGHLMGDQFWIAIRPWQSDRLSKALLSPNWGTGWFPSLEFPLQFSESCSVEELKSHVQNAMYQPTQLAHTLHQERLRQVIRTSSADPKSSPVYGAIHLRLVIMREGVEGEYRTSGIQENLVACLDRVMESNRDGMIQDWWIISDTPSLAQELAENITEYRLHEAYSLPPVGHNSDWMFDGSHSAMATHRDLFAHKVMAPSILDWMVLHQSAAAIVTDGSYGETGARGSNKVFRGPCEQYRLFW